MLELSRQDARRIAVRAQRLDADRPTDLHDLVRHLTLLQHDQTAAVAPSADLVVWARMGSAYDAQELRDALDEHSLVEVRGLVRTSDYPSLLRADMAAWPGVGVLKPWQVQQRDWVRANDACRLDLIDRLRMDGPLPTGELPDSCVRPWRSSGWNDHRNIPMLLDLMVQRGEVAVSGHEGRETWWDLAERIYDDVPVVPSEQARQVRDEQRLRALGIARRKGRQDTPAEPQGVGEAGEAATVEGVKGEWRVDPASLEAAADFEGRVALLSPLDQLVADRRRLDEVFAFDYQLEMYKPAETRIWGYWAIPVLVGDRLVGKLDARAERRDGVLVVNAVHEDEPWDVETRDAVHAEIRDLARWLDLEPVGL